MLRAWRIGRFFGVDTFIHWSFIFVPLYFIYTNRKFGIVAALLSALLSLLMMLCVLLHEYGHVLAARLFKIPTRSVTLYPIGGVALMTRSAQRPWEEMVIALAGPLVNLFIAAGMIVVGLLAGIEFSMETPAIRSFGQFYYILVGMNVALMGFNLLPAFPMDGGRVLRALLWLFFDRLNATRIAVYLAIPISIGFGLFFALVVGNFFALLITGFVIIVGQFELLGLRMQMTRERQRHIAYERLHSRCGAYPAGLESYSTRPAPEADFSGYTWDAKLHAWVEWRSGRAVRIYQMRVG